MMLQRKFALPMSHRLYGRASLVLFQLFSEAVGFCSKITSLKKSLRRPKAACIKGRYLNWKARGLT
eukprot:1136322-Pelagomonas_calceolata.AAC.3